MSPTHKVSNIIYTHIREAKKPTQTLNGLCRLLLFESN